MTETVDQSSFINWKDHPVTRQLFQLLQEIDGKLEQNMLNPEVFLDQDSRVLLARLLGNRDIIDRVLNISFVDVNQEEEDYGKEKSSSVWG